MDQTLSLSRPSPAAYRPETFCAASPPDPAAEEEPESPARSPRGAAPPTAAVDPLAEGISLLAGVALALIAVAVPVATVVLEPRSAPPPQALRARW